MATIAFDVDYTLINADNTPNYEVIKLLQWFIDNGDQVLIWSGGGTDYARTISRNLGISLTRVGIIPKTIESAKFHGVDIAIDDEFVELGKVNIKITNSTKKDGGPTV